MLVRLAAVVVLAGSAALIVPGEPARGAVVTVGGTSQEVADALANAADGDEIRIQAGTYRSADALGAFVLAGRSNVRIRALGAVIFEGSGANFSLEIQDCTDVSVEGVRFTHAGAVGKNSIGIDVDGSADIRVLRCRFTGGDIGVRHASTTGLLIEDSKFEALEDGVVALDTTTSDIDFKLNRVKMKNITGTGVTMASRYSVVEFCRFKMAAGAAGAVRTYDTPGGVPGVIVKFTRITGGVDGVQIAGDDHETFDNTIKKCERHGVAVESGTGAYVARNKVKRCGGAGVSVGTAGNIVEDNKIGKSGLFDLLSTVGEGSNTYSGNKFRTSQFGM